MSVVKQEEGRIRVGIDVFVTGLKVPIEHEVRLRHEERRNINTFL